MRLSSLLQSNDDLSYTQQLRRQEYEINLISIHEKSNQVRKKQ